MDTLSTATVAQLRAATSIASFFHALICSSIYLLYCRSTQSQGDRCGVDKAQFNEEGKIRGDCSLDEANGLINDGHYNHYFTQNFPFAPIKLSGASFHQMCDVQFSNLS